MQALILVGGEGTRLRPLTSTVPKPVVPLVDRPFLAYMLEWLAAHGVDDVVLSCGFMAAGVRNVLGDGAAFGVNLTYVEEQRPLGTGGAIKHAASFLDERFFVLNGDVLADFDLTAQLEQHTATGAQATIALMAVDDPSAYGLVRLDNDRNVTAFLEKPSPDQIDTNLVNAGAYVLERSVLDLMPPSGEACSIEREVFPRVIEHGLYGFPVHGYWLDIGTPQRYLQATFDILDGTITTKVGERLGSSYQAVGPDVSNEGRAIPPALIERGARLEPGVVVGPHAVLGSHVSVGAETRIERSVVLAGAEIGAHCSLSGCVVAAGVRIGDHCTVSEGVVIGEGVTIGTDNVLARGARVFPNVRLPDGAIRF
jgi:mannose-1-phosphate guanylyltransferase